MNINSSSSYLFVAVFFLVTLLTGCRGQKSSDPPILPIRNMVDQTSYGPQSGNNFFPDGLAARAPVPNTVVQGQAEIESTLYQGKEPNSTPEKPVWTTHIPISLSESTLARGREQYNIYCAPCHGYTGDSDGLVTQAAGGAIRPALLHDKQITALPVGKIYDAIKNGVNNWNMPGFASQISVEDRWAVVAYVRALQLSREASIKSVPPEIRSKNGWSEQK